MMMQGGVKSDKLLRYVRYLAIFLLIIAASSPVVHRGWVSDKKEGVAIALTLDLSGSMRAPISSGSDYSRFDVLQKAVLEFIQKRTNDLISIVSFASYSAVTIPLTSDNLLAKELFKKQYIGIVGERTALYDAMFQTYLMMDDAQAESKVIIVFTDGENNRGSITPEIIKEVIQQSDDVTLYTIGLGVVDEDLLREFADLGNGRFFKVDNLQQLQEVYGYIDGAQRGLVQTEAKALKHYYYIYPLFLSILLFISYLYLKNQRGL